jgi:hypothetical protein
VKVRSTISDFVHCSRTKKGQVLVDLLSGKNHLALRFSEEALREMLEGLLTLLGNDDPRCLRAYYELIDDEEPSAVPPPSEN